MMLITGVVLAIAGVGILLRALYFTSVVRGNGLPKMRAKQVNEAAKQGAWVGCALCLAAALLIIWAAKI